MSLIRSHIIIDGKELHQRSACTVYFDGGCSLCSREIDAYRQMRGGHSINWVDVSRCGASHLGGVDRTQALQRLHVQSAGGALLSGAAAFVEIWRQLPALAWIARFCSSRHTLAVLEFAYGRFLVMRRLWRKP